MNDVDRALVYLTKRKTRKNGLSPRQVLAINWFWRAGVKISILARAFGVSRNTIHYKVANGAAASYPRGLANSADDTNELVETLGPDEIKRRFVTKAMVKRVNAAMRHDA